MSTCPHCGRVPITERPLLSTVEAAALLGLSRATLDRRILRGDVPTVRYAGKRRIRRRDLDAFCAALPAEPTGAELLRPRFPRQEAAR